MSLNKRLTIVPLLILYLTLCLIWISISIACELTSLLICLQAGALMIVTLLANKVALSHDLVKSLIRSIAAIAREDVKEATDLQWLRLSFMALINLVQVCFI